MAQDFYVYIMTNQRKTVLYTGVTNNLSRRVEQHKKKFVKGFTKRYNLERLVYFENFDDGYTAIAREKKIKAGSRQNKIDLIESMNKEWKDLSDQLY
jgi:putative endonuclease